MDSFQEKMNSILDNPEMMQKIMAMANSLNTVPTEAAAPPNPAPPVDIDFNMLQKLSGLAGQSNIDSNQRTLLKALGPYLSKERISKLEKAMRAAKMAGIASVFLNQSGFNFNIGR